MKKLKKFIYITLAFTLLTFNSLSFYSEFPIDTHCILPVLPQ